MATPVRNSRLPDPFTGQPGTCPGGERKRWRPRLHQRIRLRASLSGSAGPAKRIYRGEAHEDEMVGYYPLSAFGQTSGRLHRHAAACLSSVRRTSIISIPTGPSPSPPAPTAKRNWKSSTSSSAAISSGFPGSAPALNSPCMLEDAVKENPGCDGILLGSHGLFTWGDTQRECYLNSIRTIDQMGEFIAQHQAQSRPALRRHPNMPTRRSPGRSPPRFCRVCAASCRPTGARSPITPITRTRSTSPVRAGRRNSAQLGTSCPDHFLRTRICPMFIDWKPARESRRSESRIAEQAVTLPQRVRRYYKDWADAGSPKLRDSNPSVVVIPGLGSSASGRTRRKPASPPSSSSTPFTSWPARTRSKMATRQHPYPQARHARAVASIRQLPQLRRAARAPKPSASNTGRSKKPSCSACLPKPNSAARSSWSSAAAAASAAKSRCCWRETRRAHRRGRSSMQDAAKSVADEVAEIASSDDSHPRRSRTFGQPKASPRQPTHRAAVRRNRRHRQYRRHLPGRPAPMASSPKASGTPRSSST